MAAMRRVLGNAELGDMVVSNLEWSDVQALHDVDRTICAIVEGSLTYKKKMHLHQTARNTEDDANDTQVPYNVPNQIIFPTTEVEDEKRHFQLQCDQGFQYTCSSKFHNLSTIDTSLPRSTWYTLQLERTPIPPSPISPVESMPEVDLDTFITSHACAIELQAHHSVLCVNGGGSPLMNEAGIHIPPGATFRHLVEFLEVLRRGQLGRRENLRGIFAVVSGAWRRI